MIYIYESDFGQVVAVVSSDGVISSRFEGTPPNELTGNLTSKAKLVPNWLQIGDKLRMSREIYDVINITTTYIIIHKGYKTNVVVELVDSDGESHREFEYEIILELGQLI